jgi:hypothetical protein
MAKAVPEHIPTDALGDALDRLGVVHASPAFAVEWLLTRIVDGRVGYHSRDVAPPDFWRDPREFTVNGSDVSRAGAFPCADGSMEFGTVTLRGVRVVRENIVRECPEYAEAPAESSGAAPGKAGRKGRSVLTWRRPLTDVDLAALPTRKRIFWQIVNRLYPGEALDAASPGDVRKQVRAAWNRERDRFSTECRETYPGWTVTKRWLGREKPRPPR